MMLLPFSKQKKNKTKIGRERRRRRKKKAAQNNKLKVNSKWPPKLGIMFIFLFHEKEEKRNVLHILVCDVVFPMCLKLNIN